MQHHAERSGRTTGGRRPRSAIYQQLEQEIEGLGRLGGLPSPLEAEGIWGDIWYQEAHNSTAIEGNTLVLKEVQLLLRDGKAVGDKRLADYLEVEGYARAAEWVYGQAIDRSGWTTEGILSITEVRHIHELALTPVWDVAPHPGAYPGEKPGAYRQHDIQPFPGGMRPPSAPDIPPLMNDWVTSVIQISEDPRPFPEALADRHAVFERIHPFLDGNGRTGRLVTNLILVRLGYPPAVIRKGERPRYLHALQRADEGDVGPLGELLARAVLDTLYRFIVPAVAGPARIVPLVSLADRELNAAALRGAAQRGRLKAYRGPDGNWLSSRNWLDEYKRSRSPRGRRSRPSA